ncbi:MAG: carbamoyltransferase HypF [Arcobacteraceae bacterium]|nr:carbamoyltransferase HypF [Arcobacteraceae bacterium]
MVRYKYKIKGIVQGVGFRPFVYKLAYQFNLIGNVLNDSDGVTIELQGTAKNIELFDEELLNSLPPLAHIDSFEKHPISLKNETTFEIIQTNNSSTKTTLVSPDIKVCNDCLNDIKNKEKYHNYFNTNCTNCGPRYSIIKTLPYDRVNTSMSDFTLCDSCQKEYEDPTNRRYHAQPISCKECGPQLTLSIKNKVVNSNDEIFSKTANLLQEGKIGAIKGMGGFHIVCDATNDDTITKLRAYKNRPAKPFAIMCKDLEQIQAIGDINDKEEKLLISKEAPIVVLNKLQNSNISDLIAPNITKIGCFLPYTPIHYLLFEHLDTPIVATSANMGGEPIIIAKEEIETKLPFIDFILDFNRDIINAIDDSVVQVIDNKVQTLRLSRGYAPKVIKLPFKIDKKILCVGANNKSSITIAFEDTLILSAHIGDLDNIKAFEYFTRTIETFKRFYDFTPDIIVHDLHPNYETTLWAKQQNIKLISVQHHLAHIYSVKAEHNLQKKEYIGFSFDGTGYGLDETLWGGEVFINDKRGYHFKPMKLLGGEKAIKEPRRVAMALLFENYTLEEIMRFNLPVTKTFSQIELNLLYQSYEKNINSFDTTSVGRLFDAVTSFCNLSQILSYEGESGLLLESYYDETITTTFKWNITNDIIEIKIVEFILHNTYDTKLLASMLINTLSQIIVELSSKINFDVILSGGVFQNKTLLQKVLVDLKANNKKYHINEKTPPSDGGVSLGQAYYQINN